MADDCGPPAQMSGAIPASRPVSVRRAGVSAANLMIQNGTPQRAALGDSFVERGTESIRSLLLRKFVFHRLFGELSFRFK